MQLSTHDMIKCDGQREKLVIHAMLAGELNTWPAGSGTSRRQAFQRAQFSRIYLFCYSLWLKNHLLRVHDVVYVVPQND